MKNHVSNYFVSGLMLSSLLLGKRMACTRKNEWSDETTVDDKRGDRGGSRTQGRRSYIITCRVEATRNQEGFWAEV